MIIIVIIMMMMMIMIMRKTNLKNKSGLVNF